MERSGRLNSTLSQHDQLRSRDLVSIRPHLNEQDVVAATNSKTIMGLCNSLCIPVVSIRDIGIAKDGLSSSGRVFSLGGGLTSEVVQHVTGENTQGIVPPNTIVALKVFHSRTHHRHSQDPAVWPAVRDSITREIQTFRDPILFGHPNLIQLLFVGWETNSPFPVLAMELGSHGSLDDMIKTSYSKPSILQMRHITIDIAVGLHAMHSVGLLHGDLKPDNIIIASHQDPTRNIIAKIADFGGCAREVGDKRHGDKPIHFTPLWAAPEVINQDSDADWKKADIYSYGLVVGSLWASREIEFFDYTLRKRSSCFLSLLIRPQFRDFVNEELFLLKGDDTSFLFLSHLLTSGNMEQALQAEVLALTKGPLQAFFWLRPNSEELICLVASFASGTGRKIREETLTKKKDRGDPFDRWKSEVEASFGALDYNEVADLIAPQARMIKLYISSIRSFVDESKCKVDIPPNLPENLSDRAFLLGLLLQLQRSFPLVTRFIAGNSDSSSFDEMMHKGEVYDTLALLTIGQSRQYGEYKDNVKSQNLSRVETIQNLRSAAFHGKCINTATFTIVGTPFEEEFPVRLFLSLLALSRSYWAMQILASRWPSYAAMIRRIFCNKRLDFDNLAEEGDAVDLPDLLACLISHITQRQTRKMPLTLDEALSIGAAEDARRILEAEKSIASLQKPMPYLLHRLSMLADDEAAPFAQLAVENGARLDILDLVGPPVDLKFLDVSPHRASPWKEMSPLSAAIRRGKIKLAFEILRIHVESNIPPVDLSTALELSFTYSHHGIGKALLQLVRENPALFRDDDAGSLSLTELTASFFARLIKMTINGAHYSVLECERFIFHGQGYEEAYRTTLDILLTEVETLPQNSTQWCSDCFLTALTLDDLIFTKAYFQRLQSEGRDVVGQGAAKILTCEEVIAKHNILIVCIIHDSYQCFEYLLERIPDFADEDGIYFTCSMRSKSKFLELVFKSRAKTTTNLNYKYRAALYLALRAGNLQCVHVFESSCSADQLQELLLPTSGSFRCMFFQMLCFWDRHRSPELINGVRWLVERKATRGVDSEGVPFWKYILGVPRPCARSHQLLDWELLNILLDVDSLYHVASTSIWDSVSIIQAAARNGHVEIVKMLVDRKLNISAIDNKEPPTDRLSKSALDAALQRYLGNIPEQISQAGRVEWRKWLDDLQAISIVLQRNGCESRIFGEFPEELKRQFLAGYSLREPMTTGKGSLWSLPKFVDHKLQLSTTPGDLGQWEMVEKKPSHNTWSQIRGNAMGVLFAKVKEQVRRRCYDVLGLDSIPGADTAYWQHIERENFMWEEGAASPQELERFRQAVRDKRLIWRLPPNWHLKGLDQASGLGKPLFLYLVGRRKGLTSEKPPLYRGEEEAECGKSQSLEAGLAGQTSEQASIGSDSQDDPPTKAPMGAPESLKGPGKRDLCDDFSVGDNCPPLHACLAESDDRRRVEALLRDGADLDMLYGRHTPVSLAITRHRVESLEALLSSGAAADGLVDRETRTTLLHLAARHGCPQAIRLLAVGFGANLNARDVNNRTPFIIATIAQQWATASLCKDLGADTDVADDCPDPEETDVLTYWNK
ncbi:hypothetical protein V8C37DRAFT_415013 [Trichoderma ceciliae]